MSDALRCDRAPAWAALRQHYDREGQAFDLRPAFEADAGRVQALSQEAPHLFADLSKNLLDAPTEALLMQLARECGLPARGQELRERDIELIRRIRTLQQHPAQPQSGIDDVE